MRETFSAAELRKLPDAKHVFLEDAYGEVASGVIARFARAEEDLPSCLAQTTSVTCSRRTPAQREGRERGKRIGGLGPRCMQTMGSSHAAVPAGDVIVNA
jgi:hypothetical protein